MAKLGQQVVVANGAEIFRIGTSSPPNSRTDGSVIRPAKGRVSADGLNDSQA